MHPVLVADIERKVDPLNQGHIAAERAGLGIVDIHVGGVPASDEVRPLQLISML